MKMLSKIFFSLLFSFYILIPAVGAQTGEINVYFFYTKSCPHCAKQEIFLDKLEKEAVGIRIHRFEVSESRQNIDLLKKIGQELNISITGVPFTIIGDKTVSGYYNEQVTGNEIRSIIKDYTERECPDLVLSIIGNGPNQCPHGCDVEDESCADDCDCNEKPENGPPASIEVPFFGEIDAKTISLPLLTLVIAGLDGFNPCAMWVLIFLISLLLGMENRRRMWILGGAFIFASGAVYFLFLAAWLNVILFLGFINWIRLLIGAVAVASGLYHLREYWMNKTGECKVSHGGRKQKIFAKLKEIALKRNFFVAVIGIILLAVAVNMVELICSAGLPAVYTQILALTPMPMWQYYGYLLFYIFIFMLDDMAVFFLAMTSLRVVTLNAKYSRYSNLIGGIIILILGLLLIFKPEWVMFG